MSILDKKTKVLSPFILLSYPSQSHNVPSTQHGASALPADQPNYDGNTTIMSADDSAAVNNSSTTDNHPVVDESGESATAPPPRSTRITAAAKAELHRYFTAAGYKRNTRMPKHNADKGIDSIIKKID